MAEEAFEHLGGDTVIVSGKSLALPDLLYLNQCRFRFALASPGLDQGHGIRRKRRNRLGHSCKKEHL